MSLMLQLDKSDDCAPSRLSHSRPFPLISGRNPSRPGNSNRCQVQVEKRCRLGEGPSAAHSQDFAFGKHQSLLSPQSPVPACLGGSRLKWPLDGVNSHSRGSEQISGLLVGIQQVDALVQGTAGRSAGRPLEPWESTAPLSPGLGR